MHHDDAMNAEQKNKPQIVLDYNDTKGGVGTYLNLYCIKGPLALFVLVSFSGYVC